MRITAILFVTGFVFTVAHAAPNPLPNPGFEDGVAGWRIEDPMSQVVAEAAHSGNAGLRVADDDAQAGSSVLSSKLPVKPGQTVTLTFWARASADFLGVYLRFTDATGKTAKHPDVKDSWGVPACGVKKQDGAWQAYTFTRQAPAGAAAVAVWVHSYSTATGRADLDDFALSGIEENARAVAPEPVRARPAAAAAATEPVKLPPRAKPPVIILKMDDLRQINGRVHPIWVRFADFLRARHIRGSIGVLCQTLEEATPAYAQWIKDQQASGRIEFWFHGWDHGVHTEDGQPFNEFNHRTYEDQKQRFARSQQLAKEQLGFPFRTFGPPGGVGSASFDANTLRVMAEDPDMQVWLYPTPLDEPGKRLAAAGKITILDRVWAVNIESRVGQPDYQRFVTGYAQHPDREYFVLQGHPLQWGTGNRFAEFEKIVDFLIAQQAVFVTPAAYAAERKAE